MTWIRTIAPGEAEGPLKTIYDAALARAGRVWNIVRLTSLRPGATQASLGLYQQVMSGPSGLTRAERELVATVVSFTNSCRY